MNDFEDFKTAMNILIEKKVSLKDEVAEPATYGTSKIVDRSKNLAWFRF